MLGGEVRAGQNEPTRSGEDGGLTSSVAADSMGSTSGSADEIASPPSEPSAAHQAIRTSSPVMRIPYGEQFPVKVAELEHLVVQLTQNALV